VYKYILRFDLLGVYQTTAC